MHSENLTIDNPGDQSNAEGDMVGLTISANDPLGQPLSFDAVDLPPGLSMDAFGNIFGVIASDAAEDFGGVYNTTVIVADGLGWSKSTSFTWTISDTPSGPSLTNPGSQTNSAGATVALAITASDPDGYPLSYAAAGLPSGLFIDANTGMISGTIDLTAASPTGYSVTVTVDDGKSSTNQSFDWTVNARDITPDASAPADQTSAGGDQVDLSFTASDPGGNPLTYTAANLPPGLTIDPATGDISGTLDDSAASSTPYNVSLTASDGTLSNSESFSWTVNQIGVTNPGGQANVDGDPVSLQVSASDAAGGTLAYSASGLPSGLTISSSTGLISGTISNTAAAGSPYTTTVTASDGTYSDSTTFAWTVAHLRLAGPGNQASQEHTSVSLALSAADADSDTLTYSASNLPPGLSINASTGVISGTVGLGAFANSPYQTTVTASDGSNSASQSFIWTVTPAVALSNSGPQAGAAGDSASLQVHAASLTGATLAYSASGLPAGLSINASTGLISGTISGSAAGVNNVTVIASDGTASHSQSFEWDVAPLYLPPHADQTDYDGAVVSLSLAAHYHGSGTLVYSTTGLPAGLSISSSSGLVSGTISTSADSSSPYSLSVAVTDGTHTATQSFTWYVNPVVAVDSISAQVNAPGDAVSLNVSASDALGGTLSYSASGLPSGLSINSTTGEINGTLALGADATSPYAVTVMASDGALSASQSFSWTVRHVSLANPGAQAGVDGGAVSLALAASDEDGDSVTYGASGLPSGLSINSTTGVISGTLASTADVNSGYLVTVAASDSSHTSSATFTWTVTQVAVSNPGDQTNQEGDTVSLTVSASGINGPLTYTASGLPDGLSIDSSTGVISGTIAAGAAANGPFTATVAATNGTDSSSQQFSWTVNPVVSFSSVSDQTNAEGDTVSLSASATDSLGGTLTYSASGLPGGLTIDSTTGHITGTVSAGDAAAGPSYLVLVTASDGTYSSLLQFAWGITNPGNTPPTLSNPGTQSNQTGDNVEISLSASDSDGDPLTYSATGLPDGLSIDSSTGVISGTLADDAAANAPVPVTVSVDDGQGGTASQTFDYYVNAAPLNGADGASASGTTGDDTGTLTLGTFTTPDLNSQAGDLSATIDWGDGTTEQGEVSGSSGSFSVTGDHVYDSAGSFTSTVTITSADGASTQTTTAVSIAPAALNLIGGYDLGTIIFANNTLNVAAFTDSNPDAAAGDFSVTIDWGDSSADSHPAVAAAVDGVYQVSAPHTYTGYSIYLVTITVSAADGASASATSSVSVGDIYAGIPSRLDVYSFEDPNPAASAGDFSVSVDWGDGSAPTSGTVTGTGGGLFSITADPHTYTIRDYGPPESYQVSISVADSDGVNLGTIVPVYVVNAPIQLVTNNVVATAGVGFSGEELGDFTDPNANDSTSTFSVAVNWGDGTTSSGSVNQLTPGMFQALGGHTYAKAGVYDGYLAVSDGLQSVMPFLAIVQAPGQAPPGPVKLYSLTFSNGATPDGVPLKSDKDNPAFGTELGPPQWLDKNLTGTPNQAYPYAYVNGTQATLKTVFRPKGNAGPPKLMIEGQVFVPETLEQITLTEQTLSLANGEYVFNTTFPIEKGWVGNPTYQIYWYSKVPGGKWTYVAESSDTIYVTYKPYEAVKGLDVLFDTYETVYYYGSHGLYPATANNVRDAIWSNFTGPNAARVDGLALRYYAVAQPPSSYTALLDKGNGQCNAFALLMYVAFQAQGINLNTFNIGLDPKRVPGATDFKFKPLGGQNNLNPKKLVFDSHLLIAAATPTRQLLYDPSYGKEYDGATLNAALLSFQRQRVQGYFVNEKLVQAPASLILRGQLAPPP
jgi:hypothetical protein